MARLPNRATESDIALATLQIAASRRDGIATFHRLKREIPDYVKLSDADREQSLTRRNEEIWEQLIRNIRP